MLMVGRKRGGILHHLIRQLGGFCSYWYRIGAAFECEDVLIEGGG